MTRSIKVQRMLSAEKKKFKLSIKFIKIKVFNDVQLSKGTWEVTSAVSKRMNWYHGWKRL